MANMIQRKLRVTIQIGNEARVYSSEPGNQYDISVAGRKTADATKNKMTVRVANIAKSARDYLLDGSSTYGDRREKNFIQVDAGTTHGDYSNVFVGYITSAIGSQPPDISITMEAVTGGYSALDVSTLSYSESLKNLSEISKDVAAILELDLVFEATDQKIRNWNHSGASSALIDKLNSIMAIDAYVDDNSLIVKDTGSTLTRISNVLSKESGMIGYPTQTELGCRVISKYNPSIVVGSLINVRSEVNPTLNGDYEVFEIDYNLNTRSSEWSMSIGAKTKGLNNRRVVPLESATIDTNRALARDGGTDGLHRKLIPTSKPSASTNPTSSITSVIGRKLSEMATQMPAIVLSYDRVKNMARVQGLLMLRTSDGGSVPHAPIAEVPVLAYGTKSVMMTFPLVEGSLGWIEASSADISAFIESLEIAPVTTARVFDWGDSRFIPDAFRQYTLAPGVDNAACIQSNDGSTFISLEKDLVRVVSSSNVVIKSAKVSIEAEDVDIKASSLSINSDTVSINSNVNIEGELTAGGITYNDHYHTVGKSDSSGPKNA